MVILIVCCVHFALLLLFSKSDGNSQKIPLAHRSSPLIFIPFSAIRLPAIVMKKASPLGTESQRFLKPVDASQPSKTEEKSALPISAPINPPATTLPGQTSADIIDQAKREIGKIDKELRGRTPLVPSERPDSFQSKLERGISDAYVGHADTTEDHYTAPDGVMYTRVTRNGRCYCYMSGTSNFVPGILHNSDSAKAVNCPPENSGWVK